MPFKDPEKKREYHRKYMARKKLRDLFEPGLLCGADGEPFTEEEFDELVSDLDLDWKGTKWRKERLAYYEKKYAVKEAAGMLGVHPNTLRKWIKEGKVKYIQESPNATIYIPEREINRLKDNSGFKTSKKI